MTDASRPNQQTVPGEAAAEAQTSLNQGRHYSGGDALLAETIAETQQRASDAVTDQPIATNTAGDADTDEPTDAKTFTTTGAYPTDAKRLEKDYQAPPSIGTGD